MKNSRYRQVLHFLGMAAVVLSLTCAAVHICNYLLVDDTGSYTRLTMHELYENEENIDTLFLGSSHCFRAYDPELFTELTGKTAFNLGSSSQHFDTSYYLLREAAKYNDIQTVYLDMHYKFLFVNKESRDLVQANIISDYMRPSLNKLEFLTQVSGAEHYTNRMLPFRRDWQKLVDIPYVWEVWSKKQTDAYKNYEPVVNEHEYYAGKGFVRSDAVFDPESVTWWDKFPSAAEEMNGDGAYTNSCIQKIVEFCRQNNIRLIFVTAPSFGKYLDAVEPYDAAYGYIKAMADQYGVPYLDFNLCRKERLNLSEEYFLDVDHLNGKGAEAVTRLLARLDNEEVDIDEYFKPWYDEK